MDSDRKRDYIEGRCRWMCPDHISNVTIAMPLVLDLADAIVSAGSLVVSELFREFS
jgi:hypothetical protein